MLTESAAIVTYLNDKHGGLTPKVGTVARARYNEWLSFILMELYAHTLYVMRKHDDLANLYGEAARGDECGPRRLRQADPLGAAARQGGRVSHRRCRCPSCEPKLVGHRPNVL